MSMSDCEKCWDTPCSCGWGYRHMTRAQRVKHAAVVLGVDAQVLDNMMGTLIPDNHPKK